MFKKLKKTHTQMHKFLKSKEMINTLIFKVIGGKERGLKVQECP